VHGVALVNSLKSAATDYNRTLSVKTDDRNFINRLMVKDVY